MWIASGERLVDGIEGRDRVMQRLAGEAGREAIRAGFEVVENGDLGNAFGHDQILPRALLHDQVSHFTFYYVVAAVFLTMLRERSKGPLLGPHGIL